VSAGPAKDDELLEQFQQMDLRIGTIVAAEKVSKTKKKAAQTIG
jgi:methionyl-tRNA synthetase